MQDYPADSNNCYIPASLRTTANPTQHHTLHHFPGCSPTFEENNILQHATRKQQPQQLQTPQTPQTKHTISPEDKAQSSRKNGDVFNHNVVRLFYITCYLTNPIFDLVSHSLHAKTSYVKRRKDKLQLRSKMEYDKS